MKHKMNSWFLQPFNSSSVFVLLESGSYDIAQASLELARSLPQSPKCWLEACATTASSLLSLLFPF